MKTDIKELPRSQREITVELSPEEYKPFLMKAAYGISEKVKISGFRPGKAPFDIIVQEVGEPKLWEEAFEPAIKKTLFQALREKNIVSIGSPKIDIVKFAPGNPVIYRATVNMMPKVEKLVVEGIQARRASPPISESDTQQSLHELQKIRAAEKLVPRPARLGDKVEVDFTIYMDTVPLEGGMGKKIPVILGENKFIPGFEEKLIGMKAGEEKEFSLTFPKNYYQKNLAGKLVDFRAKACSVFERELPKLDDEFAKNLRFENLEALKKHIHKNLLDEAARKEERRLEDDIIEKLLEKNRFSDIPDVLVQSEAQAMFQEFEQNIRNDGLNFDEYLAQIKKTRQELFMDFTPGAVKRVKVALLFRELATVHNLHPSDKDVESQYASMKQQFEARAKSADAFQGREAKEYVRNILTSKKIMDFLKERIVSEKK